MERIPEGPPSITTPSCCDNDGEDKDAENEEDRDLTN